MGIISHGFGKFTDLTDVPNSYTGNTLKYVRVNSTGTGLEFVTGGGEEFINFLTFKSTINDTFKVTQQFSTTAPTQYIFTNKTNNPDFYLRMPDGVDEPSTGESGFPGGNASNVIFQIGSGGDTSDAEGAGGDAGNFIVKLGEAGFGSGGSGTASSFLVTDNADQIIFSVAPGSVVVSSPLTVSGTLNLIGLPTITVNAQDNNLPVITIDNRATCNTATVAGFGNRWSFISQAGNSTLETGAITNTLMAVNPHAHSRMMLTVRGQSTFAEGFRFESDNTNDGVALCAIGGQAIASTKLMIYTQKSGYVGLVIRPVAGQTAGLQQWQDSAGVTQLAIAANGRDFVLDTTTGSKIGTSTSQKLGFWNATPVTQSTGWNPTNVTTDKVFDADSTSTAELADVLGTLINQLKTYGILGG